MAQASGGLTNLDYLLAGAQSFVNQQVQYAWGGTPSPGHLQTDCSGMIQYLFNNLGYQMPRTSEQQVNTGTAVSLQNIQPGDLIFYNYEGPNSHVALYIGNGEQIAESTTGTPASVQSIDTSHVDAVRSIGGLGNTAQPNQDMLDLMKGGDVDPANFETSSPTEQGGDPGTQGDVAGQTQTDPGVQTGTDTGLSDNVPTPPSLGPGNTAAWMKYIQTNFPEDYWMMNVPELSSLIEQSVSQGWSSDQLQARVEATNWWKTTSSAMRNYEQLSATDPSALSFSTPGSQAQQQLNAVQTSASAQGVQLTGQQAQTLALDSIKYGWNAAQIQQNVGSMVSFTSGSSAQTLTGGASTNDEQLYQQLTQLSGEYAQPMSASGTQQWMKQIAAGTQTVQSYQAELAKNAAAQYPTLAAGLAQGQTVTQLLDPQITGMANLLEIDPTEIQSNLLTNHYYNQLLTGGGGNATADQASSGLGTGAGSDAKAAAKASPQPMTTAQADQLARSMPQWQYTQNARDTAGDVANAVVQAFGQNVVS